MFRIWVLIREGLNLGYPLWLLRLSISTYKMSRVVRVKKVVSGLIWAYMGHDSRVWLCDDGEASGHDQLG